MYLENDLFLMKTSYTVLYGLIRLGGIGKASVISHKISFNATLTISKDLLFQSTANSRGYIFGLLSGLSKIHSQRVN